MKELRDITIYRIDNNKWGNPRYVVHFLNLSNDYVSIRGFRKYHNKNFGGGYVFSSYTPKMTLEKYFRDKGLDIQVNIIEKRL